jgi:hypothetical protein
MCIIVNLSSLNYPEVIPQVYKHFDTNVLSQLDAKDRFSAAQQVREGLIKSTGIVGAARTGNAMRTLSECMPDEFRERESPRSKESDEVARKRGREFWSNVYSQNPAFDPAKTERASPDYTFIVRGKPAPLSPSFFRFASVQLSVCHARSPLRTSLLL